jgi:septal ring factor EnvC (AmiA/AmiB activator)
MKKNQEEIKKAEARLRELSSKESGVLKNISEIDNGLTRTRESLNELQKKERDLNIIIKNIVKEIEILQKNIEMQKEAIASRIKNLYIYGKREEWELLFNLLKENENPERKLYWVSRLLENDRTIVENYQSLMDKQKEKKIQLEAKQKEMVVIHESKTSEERKLQNQLLYQNEVLAKVKNDKSTQEKAIEEYKRNQQALVALITALEKKRQAELTTKKKAEEKKGTKTPQKGTVVIPKETPVAIGPKCTPLNGEIISEYGHHINKVLNIKIMHLGTEIRGQKGEGIKAAAAGTVVMISNLPGHGPSVIIDHNGSYYSVYGHLGTIKVKNGETVKSCQEIGTVGNAESSNGYKLYFQVYKGTQAQDPMRWLRN